MDRDAFAPARRFKDLAEAALPGRIERVVLFGSRARGDASEASDWDVAVVFRGPPPRRHEERFLIQAAYRVLCETNELVLPLALTEDRARSDSFIARNLGREGHTL